MQQTSPKNSLPEPDTCSSCTHVERVKGCVDSKVVKLAPPDIDKATKNLSLRVDPWSRCSPCNSPTARAQCRNPDLEKTYEASQAQSLSSKVHYSYLGRFESICSCLSKLVAFTPEPKKVNRTIILRTARDFCEKASYTAQAGDTRTQAGWPSNA